MTDPIHKPADLARTCAAMSCRIRTELPVSQWKSALEALEPEYRELTRTYLAQYWRGQQHRQRVGAERGGPVSQTEIQRLQQVLG